MTKYFWAFTEVIWLNYEYIIETTNIFRITSEYLKGFHNQNTFFINCGKMFVETLFKYLH